MTPCFSAQQSTDSDHQVQGLESAQVVTIEDVDDTIPKADDNATVKVSAVKRGAENVFIGPAKLTVTEDKRLICFQYSKNNLYVTFLFQVFIEF